MTQHTLFELAGTWSGTKQLWLDPAQPPSTHRFSAQGAVIAGGSFLRLSYAWSQGTRLDEGEMVIAPNVADGAVCINWVDSFHSSRDILVCRREPSPAGALVGRGSYAAPPGPDWGWRITLRLNAEGEMDILMHNIWPEGREDIAVRIIAQRG